MGIAEQNMFGVAAGLATLGWIPFVSTFASFAVCRALDPIRVLIAQPSLGVKIAGGYSGLLTGLTGKTHQVLDDIAVMRAMAHMTVIAPGDAIEAEQAIRAAADIPGPVYLRLTRDPSPVLMGPGYNFVIGRAVPLRSGSDIGLISTGTQTARVVATAEILAREGIEAAILHLPTIKPLDAEAIIAFAEHVPAIVTSEEHTILGGLGGAVSEVLSRHRPTRILRHGIDDTFGESAPNEALLEKYGLLPTRLAAVVRGFLEELR
jgi:transketolase